MDADEDPTRALDGWRPDRGPRPTDAELTRMLDGWQPQSAAPPARRAAGGTADIKLPRFQPAPGAAAEAVDVDILGSGLGQRIARRQAALDITDIDLDWQPTAMTARAPAHPRVLERWQAGAWVAAVRQVAESTTEVRDGPHGPVVETFGALRLIAWWPPLATPGALLDRWPQRALLQAIEVDRLQQALVDPLPADAHVWCIGDEADWPLIGQLVLLHDTTLPRRHFDTLQAFVEAEREVQFKRLNDGYQRAGTGPAVERR